jgi:hypothetical protein
MSRLLIAAAFAAGVAACAPMHDVEGERRAATKFDAELAGMAPGRGMSCLPTRSTASVVAARGPVLLFREGRRVYANHTSGGCEAAANGHYALVSQNYGGGGTLCRGTIARVVDLTGGGIVHGSCALGDFTPYTRR